MTKRFTSYAQILCGSAFLTGLVVPAQPAALSGKKLIEFGWDEPDTVFLRTHIREMQRTPFDGCVFHVDYRKLDGTKGSFTWQC